MFSSLFGCIENKNSNGQNQPLKNQDKGDPTNDDIRTER